MAGGKVRCPLPTPDVWLVSFTGGIARMKKEYQVSFDGENLTIQEKKAGISWIWFFLMLGVLFSCALLK